MTPTEKLRFARRRHSAAVRALNAVRHKVIVRLGQPRTVGSFTVYDKTVDLNAAERARLCRRANRLLRYVDLIAARHGLSLAL